MKKIFVGFFLTATVVSGCGKYIADFSTAACRSNEPVNAAYSKADELENVLEEFTQQGIPGVVLGVLSSESYWESAKGNARLESKTPMEVCHLQYLQSISKNLHGGSHIEAG